MSHRARFKVKGRQAGVWGLAVLLGLALSGCAGSRELSRAETPEAWRAALQPALAATQEALLAAGPSLHDALLLALERNPGIEAARRQWLAAIHRMPQASALPDAMFSADYRLEGGGEAPRRWSELEWMQPLPWPGKLSRQGRVAAVEAELARLRLEAAARDLIIDVKDACYELDYLDTAGLITERIEALLREHGLLAYGELARGRATLPEAFRAESAAAQLAYDRILLAEQRAAVVEGLRALLNLPPQTTIGPPARVPVYPLSDDLPDLQRRAEVYSEALRARGLETLRARYELQLARLARVPDFSLGAMLEKAARGGMDDMVLGVVGASLPIWEQRNRALAREKEALAEAAAREALHETNLVRRMVAESYFQARLTQRLARLYAETLLPQAEEVMRQAERLYRSEQAAFSSVLETTLAYHNFTLAYHRARADHGQAIGRLERVLGYTAQARVAPIESQE